MQAPKFLHDVVVAGGANFDYLVISDGLPKPGETVSAHGFREAPGGKGANQAVAAARMGAKVALIGRVGADDRGEIIRERLVDEGVDLGGLFADPHAHTGIALITVGGRGEKQIAADLAANQRLSREDISRSAKLLSSTRVLLVQLEIPLEAVFAAIAIAKASGAEILLDPAPAIPLPEVIFRELDLIRPNASEAEVLTGVHVSDRRSARRAAKILLERGARAVCVQAGDEGDLLVQAERDELFLPRYEIESVDATGAGDAFMGVLAAMRAQGLSLAEAAKHASAAAALKTTRVGAQAGLPSREALLAFMARQERRSLDGAREVRPM
jgi:ribokinase